MKAIINAELVMRDHLIPEAVLFIENGKIAAIVDGGSCGVGLESTVISLATEVPTVLRPGGITVEQLKDYYDAEFEKAVADTAYVVLDVRTPAEHAEGYIPGTHLNIDVLEDDYTEIALRNLPKDKPVALYCRSGNRSKNAARILAEKGYQVLELGTGFRGWVAAGKDVEKQEL